MVWQHKGRIVHPRRLTKLTLLEQVRLVCKHYDDISGIGCLPLADNVRTAAWSRTTLYWEVTDRWRASTVHHVYTSKNKHFFNYCGFLLREVVDVCMSELMPLKVDDSVRCQAYWCLYSYIYRHECLVPAYKHMVTGQLFREDSAIPEPVDFRSPRYRRMLIEKNLPYLSRAVFYNRLNLGMAMLAQHISLFIAHHTGNIEYVEVKSSARKFLARRELEVLRLAAEGLSDFAVVAERMCVSKGTVSTYWKRIRAKLGARDNAEALLFAERLQLVDL